MQLIPKVPILLNWNQFARCYRWVIAVLSMCRDSVYRLARARAQFWILVECCTCSCAQNTFLRDVEHGTTMECKRHPHRRCQERLILLTRAGIHRRMQRTLWVACRCLDVSMPHG